MTNLRVAIIGLHNHYPAIPFADELQKGISGMELVGVSDERRPFATFFVRHSTVVEREESDLGAFEHRHEPTTAEWTTWHVRFS